MVVLVAAGFIISTLIQIIVLLKKSKYKETLLVIILMIFSLLYGISGITEWNFPSPGAAIEAVFRPLSNLIFDAETRQ